VLFLDFFPGLFLYNVELYILIPSSVSGSITFQFKTEFACHHSLVSLIYCSSTWIHQGMMKMMMMMMMMMMMICNFRISLSLVDALVIMTLVHVEFIGLHTVILD